MTGNRRRRGVGSTTVHSPLARRLVVAFVAIAVAVVFVFAGLTLWRTRHTVGRLANDRRHDTAETIARTLALSYQQTHSWASTDIHPASMLAVQADATITVTDTSGRELSLPNSMGPMTTASADPRPVAFRERVTVVVDNVTVGNVSVAFTDGELALAEQHVRDALYGTIALGSFLAAIVAITVAVPVSRRIVSPLDRITETARRLGNGDVSARVAEPNATGELGVLAATFDQMAEQLQAHETTRRHLTADLTHELRTPLTLIQGSCEELIDGHAEPDLARIVQLHDDILRVRRLVDDLATLTDADTATTQGTANHQLVDLATIARVAVDRLRDLIAASSHELVTELQPVMVLGDHGQLIQIITNLLTNAIKFTPPGGTIRINVVPDPTTSTATVVVADNGPGISDTDRPHVFERFYRSDRTRHIAGTGIGLVIAQQLVTAHHGTITIDPTPSGTTIRVSFPAQLATTHKPS